MKTTIKEITPQWASRILETRNPNNRNLSDKVVSKYASDMTNGDWGLTHQGIAFDENGDLLDGQHRLAAVVSCKKPVKMMVTTGIPSTFKNNGHTSTTFACIDGVKPRTPATNLEILKYKNTNVVASAARAVAMAVTGNCKVVASASAVEQIVRMMSPSIERLASVASGTRIAKVRTAGIGAIAFFHTTHPNEAEQFLLDVQSVSGGKGSASRALATWISRHPATGSSGQQDLVYVTSSALWHHFKKTSVEKLYGSEDSVRWLLSTNQSLKKQVEFFFKS